MDVLQGALLEELLVDLNFIGDAQVVRNLGQNDTVLQSFRLLVTYKGLEFMLISMTDNHFIGVDHAKAPRFDVLFLTECEQHIEELFIRFEHFTEFHDAAISNIEFAIEAICAWVVLNAALQNGIEVNGC